MTEPGLLLDRIDADIAVARLNRPDKRNAIDTATLDLVNDTLEKLAADTDLRVLVISTTTLDALCAGADVTEMLDAAGGVRRMEAFTRAYRLLDEFPVPTIAVCVGNCVGAGAELAAGCDLRVGGDNLKLAWAGGRLGVPVGPARLAPLVGLSRAKDLVLTGRVVGMEEAATIGFLNRTAAAAAAEEVALDLARSLVRQSADGVRVLKAMFRELEDSERRVAYENERLMDFQQFGSGLPKGS